jgi:DNA-binding transcriptional regulator YdaS (Cro superfamily)
MGMNTVMHESSPELALQRAIKSAGGYTALAKLIGVSRPAVARWSVVPPLRVLAVEQASGVPRRELRPDLYPE